MNQQRPNHEELRRMAREAGKVDPVQVQRAAQSGRIEDLLGKMSQEDADRVRELLSDEQKTKALLSSPAAQALLRKLMGK